MAKKRATPVVLAAIRAAKRSAERIDKAYADYLRGVGEANNLKEGDIPGKNYKAVWRVWEYRPDDRTKLPPSISAAAQVAVAMQHALPAVKIAPPCVLVTDGEHYEWMEIGTRLKQARPELFTKMLEWARDIDAAQASGERTLAKMSRLIDTLRNLATDFSASAPTDSDA